MRRLVLSLAGFLALSALATASLAAPKVVTDIAPVQSLVAMVMGDLGTPGLLLPKGADPHDFQLRPSQARALADADLVVWVGAPLSPWLDRAYSGIEAKASLLTLLDAPDTEVRNFRDTQKADPQGSKTDSGAQQTTLQSAGQWQNDRDPVETGVDPHAWLDPQKATIAASEAGIATKLAPLAAIPFVTYHQAYGYFTTHFGLAAAGSVRTGDAAAPGAARLSALQQGLRRGDAVCLFPEVNHNPAQSAQLIEGTATRLGGALDPAGVDLNIGPTLYVALMETLADTLASCLSDR